MPEKIWRYTMIAASALLLSLLLHYHFEVISAPVPLDLYEGTAPQITAIIAEGHNPYTRPYQPSASYVYPPLYHLLVAPLTQVFDNNLQLHRAVSAVFIALACLMCALATQRLTHSRVQGFAAACLLYAALLFYGTPVASTNALGVGLYLATLLVPWWRNFSSGSLCFALACSVLAFYSKQYFILAMAILCLYLFLFHSMRRGLLLGIGFALCLLTSLFLVHQTSPYYLDNTFFTPQLAARGLQMWSISALQFQFFLTTYAGLLLAVALVAIPAALAMVRQGRWLPELNERAGLLSGGALLSRPLDYFWFWLFWAALVNALFLARNPGNFMTYLFQLMSAPLIIAGLALLHRLQGRQRLLAPLLLVTYYQAWAILPKDFEPNLGNWQRVGAMIEQSEEVLGSQMLITTLMEKGKAVHQNGHTFYFPLAANKPQCFIKDRKEDRVSTIWQEYIEDLYRRIEAGTFDLILVSPWEMRGIFKRNPPPGSDLSGREFLEQHYQLEERIPLSMTDRYGGGTYQIQVWRPRPAQSDSMGRG